MLLIAMLSLMLTCNSCSSDGFVEPRSLTAGEISGIYLSDGPVGVLGALQLELVRIEQTRVYAARVSGEDEEQFGNAEGVGTLADDHLVLHFDRGEEYDYYFEGDVVSEEGSSNIEGEFVFPDQTEVLVVNFSLLR